MSKNTLIINFQDVHFMEQLRKVELCDFDLYPEPENSGLDWPFEDKVHFYIQAYALNSLEALLKKKLTFKNFEIAFENKVVINSNGTTDEYFYDGMLLFSKVLIIDENDNLFYIIII